MSRQLGHPDPAVLSSLLAGLVSPRRGERLSAHAARCPRCARVCRELDAVSGILAAAPLPPLPQSLERRVLTALSLESVSRMRQPDALAGPAGQRHHPGARRAHRSPVSQRFPPRRPSSRSSGRRPGATVQRAFGMPQILVPAVAGLLVLGVGAGYLIRAWWWQPQSTRTAAFLVTDTGTSYQKATLRTQVRDTLAARASVPTVESVQPDVPSSTAASPTPGIAVPSPVPATTTGPSPASRPAATVAPSQALVGCVMHLTGNTLPTFVDRATYQSEPVYVIAAPDQAWVVGVDCTAAHPTLIASVQLATGS